MGRALLIIVVGFTTIFSSVMFSITSNQHRSAQTFATQYYNWIAHNATESVTNVTVSRLFRNLDAIGSNLSYTFNGAASTVTIQNITGDSTTEAEKIMATIATAYENQHDTTTVILMKPAYSYYYFYLYNWPNFMEYGAGDTLMGPIHTNSMMRVRDKPIFIGKYSSDQANYQPVVAGDNPKFYGGAEFGTQNIPLPDLSPLEAEANSGGDVFNEDTWLTFQGISYRCSTKTASIDETRLFSDINGTIMTTGGKDIYIKGGTVDGQVTVLSDNAIYIEDDIRYAVDPRINANSDDYLGLIAKHRVWIVDNAANSTNVEIHAAIIARHDEINVENYDSGSPRGTLTILGSLAENDALPYGTYSGAMLVTGYEGIHIYDIRLRDKTPPYFPRLNRFEIYFRSD